MSITALLIIDKIGLVTTRTSQKGINLQWVSIFPKSIASRLSIILGHTGQSPKVQVKQESTDDSRLLSEHAAPPGSNLAALYGALTVLLFFLAPLLMFFLSQIFVNKEVFPDPNSCLR
jgi:hypothetical protein